MEKVRREFFWSALTLRCDVWVEDDKGEHLERTEDCLRTDWSGCIKSTQAYPNLIDLIPELLTDHFGAHGRNHI